MKRTPGQLPLVLVERSNGQVMHASWGRVQVIEIDWDYMESFIESGGSGEDFSAAFAYIAAVRQDVEIVTSLLEHRDIQTGLDEMEARLAEVVAQNEGD